jgi:hypothetical protein
MEAGEEGLKGEERRENEVRGLEGKFRIEERGFTGRGRTTLTPRAVKD